VYILQDQFFLWARGQSRQQKTHKQICIENKKLMRAILRIMAEQCCPYNGVRASGADRDQAGGREKKTE
jgi:hypothetical protein